MTAADTTVAAWPTITRSPGDIYRLKSGGFLVNVGDAYPVYRHDEADARTLLRGRNLPATRPVTDL